MSRTAEKILTFTSAVPRQKVHRAAICEVFLTDSARVDEDTVLLAAQLPRVHSYYSDQASNLVTYDVMLLTECCRQGAVYLAHEHLDVPADHCFVLNDCDLTITNPEATLVGPRPGDLELRATVVRRKHRDGVLTGITLDIGMSLHAQVLGTCSIEIQWMPPNAWDKLRMRGRAGLGLPLAPAPTATASPAVVPLAPAAVARCADSNVVIGNTAVGGSEVSAGVVVNQGHPALFDHPLDHVPGMLLAEAMRQTSLVAADQLLALSPGRLSVARCTMSFTRFVEFELPIVCTAALDTDADRGTVRFTTTVSQDGVPVAHGVVDLRPTAQLGTVIPAPARRLVAAR